MPRGLRGDFRRMDLEALAMKTKRKQCDNDRPEFTRVYGIRKIRCVILHESFERIVVGRFPYRKRSDF